MKSDGGNAKDTWDESSVFMGIKCYFSFLSDRWRSSVGQCRMP